MEPSKPYLNRRDAAIFLCENSFQITRKTLDKYATTGGGPPYRKFGRRCLYTPADLIEWAESKLSEKMSSTSGRAQK